MSLSPLSLNPSPGFISAGCSTKAYLHVLGRSSINGSQEEGNVFSDSTQHLFNVLTEIHTIQPSLLTLIEQCKEWAVSTEKKIDISDEIITKARGLPNNHSLLLPGGWRRVGGIGGNHAMLYEVTREDDQHFRLCVINADHTPYVLWIINNKKAYQIPAIIYRKVPQNILFEGGGHLIFNKVKNRCGTKASCRKSIV